MKEVFEIENMTAEFKNIYKIKEEFKNKVQQIFQKLNKMEHVKIRKTI